MGYGDLKPNIFKAEARYLSKVKKRLCVLFLVFMAIR